GEGIHRRYRRRHHPPDAQALARRHLHRGSDRGQGRDVPELRALPLDGDERPAQPHRDSRGRSGTRGLRRSGNRPPRETPDRTHARVREKEPAHLPGQRRRLNARALAATVFLAACAAASAEETRDLYYVDDPSNFGRPKRIVAPEYPKEALSQ